MNFSLLGFATVEAVRVMRRAAVTMPILRLRYAGTPTARLTIAPQDLRTADPTVANEIYAGRFAFAGKLVSAGGRPPFEIEPPSAEWAEALYGFGWLRHLRAAASPLARANARALVEEWIDLQGGWHKLAWRPDILSRRVLAWLAQSPLVLEQADYAFYRKFVASLTKQIHVLTALRTTLRSDTTRLQVCIALAQASLCLEHHERLQKRASGWLAAELKAQILDDGGHISRNPALLLQLLLDLLPLRQSYVASSLMPPQNLISAIDRMIPMLRFFRHADGAFALFNGMGPTSADVVATLLAYDETRGHPPEEAPNSGYERMQAGSSLVLFDAGLLPPLKNASTAHAGALSFEFSDKHDRIVVNCGVPWIGRAAWAPFARLTAAHSTLQIENLSSADFVRSSWAKAFLGALLVPRSRQVNLQRKKEVGFTEVSSTQGGYNKTHGVVHQRTLRLGYEGEYLAGVDELLAENASRIVDAPFTIRFHLHPSVRASLIREGEAVLILLPDRSAWEFSAVPHKISLEESVYLGGADGPRRTEQIVVYGRTKATPSVEWQFVRHKATVPVPPKEEAPLLL